MKATEARVKYFERRVKCCRSWLTRGPERTNCQAETC